MVNPTHAVTLQQIINIYEQKLKDEHKYTTDMLEKISEECKTSKEYAFALVDTVDDLEANDPSNVEKLREF